MANRTVRVVLEAATSGYEQGMKRAEKATEGVGKATDKLGQDAEKSGGKATGAWGAFRKTITENEAAIQGLTASFAVAGAAGAALAVMAVKSFADFDEAMSGAAAASGETAENMGKLRDEAIRLGADTVFSATEAAQGIENLARAGVETADILGGGLAGSLDLAAAGQMEVADAAELASAAMTQFKLSGEDVPHVADLLAAGAGKAMGEVSDLGMALKQGGLVASQFGLSIEETVGGLSAFASNALLGSDAGTSLRTMLLALANPSKETAELMRELGIDAYDASGQFIGLEGLAGVLRDRLYDLTDAQRQQTLAQIFGTDAIRAASILYDEGAEGIAKWTDAVNDSGYAAEQAAKLQDNLKGDLEQLGGAWETLMIQMGEGANGPLRAIVQGLDDFISTLGETPGAAQALLVVTGGLGGLLIAAAGLMQGAIFVNSFKTSIDALGLSGGKLSKLPGILRGVGKAAGYLGAALIALEGIKWLDKIGEGSQDLQYLEATLRGVAGGTRNLDDAFRSVDGKALSTDLFGAIETIYDLESAMKAIDNAWWSSTEANKARDAFREIDAAIKGMDLESGAEAFAEIEQRMRDWGWTSEQIAEQFPQYFAQMKGALQDSSGDWASYSTDVDSVLRLMRGDLPAGLVMTEEGIMHASQAAQDGAPLMGELAAASETAAAGAEALAEAAEAQAEALDDALDSIVAYYDAVMASENSAIALEASFDKATEAVEKNGKTLDINTEKGRANREALLGIAGAALKHAEDLGAAGASTEEITGATQRAREQFVKAATDMGMTKDAANAYADELGLIPSDIATSIKLPGVTDAQAQADLLWDLLDKLPPEVRSQIKIGLDKSGYWEADRILNSINGRTATATITIRRLGQAAMATGGYVGDFATAPRANGLITGPGGPTDDKVAIWASNKEYMFRAKAVESLGLERLDYMNRTGKIPHFADGGLIERPQYQRSPYVSMGMTSDPVAAATIDTSAISAAVRDGLADARFLLDGKELDVKIGHAMSRTANSIRRGA